MLADWSVPGTTSKAKLRPGDPWPLNSAVKRETYNKCNDCNKEYTGKIVFRHDEQEEAYWLLGVKQELSNG